MPVEVPDSNFEQYARSIYDGIAEEMLISFPHPQSQGGGLHSLDQFRMPFYHNMIEGELDRRPDFKLWWSTLQGRPLSPDEYEEATGIATFQDKILKESLKKRGIHPDESACFALAAIYRTAKNAGLNYNADELSELHEDPTIWPVIEELESLLIDQSYDPYSKFLEVVSLRPSTLATWKQDLISDPETQKIVSALGILSIAIPAAGIFAPQALPYLCALACLPAGVAGAGIGLSLVTRGYSFDDVMQMRRNVVLFNELIKD